jgi:nickel-dependent lactate racemase
VNIDIEMKLIKQTFQTRELGNIKEMIQKEIKKINFCQKIKPGMRIGITAGSRGIDRIHEVINIISNEVKKCGGFPIVVAAMGSHGGATKKGQLEILRHYRIIEENIGAPIIATDKSFVIGYLENGLPVYVNDLVKSLDAILVVNRIKVHTSFKAPIESGLNKMTAIGLGHHKGASLIHSLGIENLHRNILRFSNRILKELPIIGGIGLL